MGTWVYTNGTTSLTVVLKKKVHYNITDENEYEDIIYGEYRYVENGVEKFNSLAQIDDPTITNYFDHKIDGNFFPKGRTILDHELGNPGLVLSLSMLEVEIASDFSIFKTTLGGVEALRAFKMSSFPVTLKGTPEPQRTVPSGYYTLLKQ